MVDRATHKFFCMCERLFIGLKYIIITELARRLLMFRHSQPAPQAPSDQRK